MPLWVVYAAGSALFAGLTAILAKLGIRHTPSNLATAVRTVVVLVLAWLMVLVAGSQQTITGLEPRTWIFLVLSGLATGASWLCYFRALQLGEVNKVVVVDKSSVVLTVGLGIVLLGETDHLVPRLIGIAGVGIGTYLMIERTDWSSGTRGRWLWYAIGSAVFAALTAILGKIGIAEVESNLGTAIRTVVVLVMAWVVVFVTGEHRQLRTVPGRELVFVAISGIATGASWLCYWRAMQEGPASLVAPIDKLSVLITVGFAWLVFGERLRRRALLGLGLIVAGTAVMLL
ncbi:MAG: EamA family transporter [Propionicimonas sp.]|uniref:EamA family transporter n=1 Tax=Propionicimonas sp. TaxID=1955623 RepID=UPI002B20CAE1|nr:EamA family transporter [Propionicimonas sp.]MEA4945855.1 EamA family transporter [Propionicimonas sp.]MEA5055286.1 EamA family transporter [Propionicimonas sp.]MEA5116698.1 EamA family transporter [Propionicimonas sp.]